MKLPLPNYPVYKMYDKMKASQVLAKVEEVDLSQDICEWACRALASISASAMQTQNAELLTDFLDCGACETLVTILSKYSATSQIIASYGCAAIFHLSWSSGEIRDFLGVIGACEVIVYSMTLHVGDPDVSEYGSGAFCALAHGNISNSFKLAESGGCDGICEVGCFGFNLRHPKCSLIAGYICLGLAQLCEAANVKRLMDCRAGEMIIQLLRLHMEKQFVVQYAVKALCGLASLNFQMREMLGHSGCCDIIVEVLQKYFTGDIAIVAEACETIMHLSLSPTNALKLSNASACAILVSSLRDRLLEYHFGAEICCGAMLNLVTYGSCSLENRGRLIGAGAVEQIRLARMSTKASYRARESADQLLQMLGADIIPRSGSDQVDLNKLATSDSFRGIVHSCEPCTSFDVAPLAIVIREYESFSAKTKFLPLIDMGDDEVDEGSEEEKGSRGKFKSPSDKGIIEI